MDETCEDYDAQIAHEYGMIVDSQQIVKDVVASGALDNIDPNALWMTVEEYLQMREEQALEEEEQA